MCGGSGIGTRRLELRTGSSGLPQKTGRESELLCTWMTCVRRIVLYVIAALQMWRTSKSMIHVTLAQWKRLVRHKGRVNAGSLAVDMGKGASYVLNSQYPEHGPSMRTVAIRKRVEIAQHGSEN